MSQEYVEIMCGVIDAFNRRDAEALEALLASDAEIVPIRAALEGTVYRAPGAAKQWLTAIDESWESMTFEVEEMRDGGDLVLALGRIRGHGRGSGAPVDGGAASLVRFRHGLITSLRVFTSRAEALEAAGLSE